jgi:hypothetical protein
LTHHKLDSLFFIFNKFLLSFQVDVGLDPGTAFNLKLIVKLLADSQFLFDVFSPLVKTELLDMILEYFLLLELPIVDAVVKAPLAVDSKVFAELHCFLLTHLQLDVWEEFWTEFS